LRLDGKTGEWLGERIKEGVPRILGSFKRRTFNLESEKRLQQQRDMLAKTLQLYDEGQKEIKSVENVVSVLEYLAHWFAWWGSMFSLWFGFLQTRRILDTRNQALINSQKLAQAILEVAKEQGEQMTREESEKIADELLLVKAQQQRILEEIARWEEMRQRIVGGGPGPAAEDIAAVKKLAEVNEGLKGLVTRDESGSEPKKPEEPKPKGNVFDW
jgi:hypothetical protein